MGSTCTMISGGPTGYLNLLVDLKVDPGMLDETGLTSMHVASVLGPVYDLSFLLDAKGNVNQMTKPPSSLSPCHFAVLCDQYDILEFLLSVQADVHARSPLL